MCFSIITKYQYYIDILIIKLFSRKKLWSFFLGNYITFITFLISLQFIAVHHTFFSVCLLKLFIKNHTFLKKEKLILYYFN